MKAIFLILALLPTLAQAGDSNGEPDLNFCYPNGGVFFHRIIAKIGKNKYEMVSEVWVLGHGVLKTKRPVQPGAVGMPMKYVGRKPMLMANGFTAQVRQWEECK